MPVAASYSRRERTDASRGGAGLRGAAGEGMGGERRRAGLGAGRHRHARGAWAAGCCGNPRPLLGCVPAGASVTVGRGGVAAAARAHGCTPALEHPHLPLLHTPPLGLLALEPCLVLCHDHDTYGRDGRRGQRRVCRFRRPLLDSGSPVPSPPTPSDKGGSRPPRLAGFSTPVTCLLNKTSLLFGFKKKKAFSVLNTTDPVFSYGETGSACPG